MHWMVTSNTLLDICQEKVTGGATHESPDGDLSMKIHQMGFVNDVMNRTNIDWEIPQPGKHLDELLAQASRNSELGHGLIEAGNQALELSKCKCQIFYFDFAPNREPKVNVSPKHQHHRQ